MNTLTYLGIRLPVSIQSFKDRREVRGIKAGSNSVNWRGAEWLSPTSLDFEQTVLRSQEIGADYMVESSRTDPETFVKTVTLRMERSLYRIELFLYQSDYVLDTTGLKVDVRSDDTSFFSTNSGIQVRIRGYAWPLEPGITGARDTTL